MFFKSDTEQGRLRVEFHNTAVRIKDNMCKSQKRYYELLILYKHTTDEGRYKYAWELKHNIEGHLNIDTFRTHPVILEILMHWVETKMYSKDVMPDLKFYLKVKEDNMLEEVELYIDEQIKLKLGEE